MTELRTKIREVISGWCSDMCTETGEKAIVAVLQLHDGDDDGHMCIKEIIGYTVLAWYGPGEDCPTVVAIARALGALGEEDREP